jgi:NAD+ diphosphatase
VTERLLPDFAFQGSAHDRMSDVRTDVDFLAECWADPASRVVVVSRGHLAWGSHGGGLALFTPADAPAGERVLLGRADGVVYFAVLSDPAAAKTSDLDLRPLRTIAAALDRLQGSLAVHTVALAQWHERHARCAVCGGVTVPEQAGAVRRCTTCASQHFPRTDPAVIMLVVDDDDRCLLGHNAARDASWYSTLAGFVEPGETLEDAVVREVSEETGVCADEVRYVGSQPWPFPSSLMLGFMAHAARTSISVDGVEITKARWFTRDELRREVEAGELVIPTTVSISGALIQRWYGAALPQRRTD